ncbi:MULTISPECIES: ASCH domain-containing protein [Agrobacterium]|uniref:hypothetical protein n=1 Tax=Agrobacterium TaxID=357 RepID=UPI0027816879|nr:hypothetical protein [Agrobacterium sp. SORGH_AS_0745]MDP9758287.1 hypothetical protein [Agrobacterium tumefaciens]MDQ1219526.1 hypothetical protein [Agrobacterium sp. SORGH_AS_0745]
MNQQASADSRIDFVALADRVAAGQVKALSIKQPYPHHIFHDGKDVENRDWPTKGRGWFIVHAGVSKSEIDKDDDDQMAMPRGGVVGMARIVDCVREMDSRWFFGKFGFVLRDAFPLPLIPCRGQLSFFKLEPDVNQLLADAIRQRAGITADHLRGTEQ